MSLSTCTAFQSQGMFLPTVVSSMLQYTTLNTIQLYSTTESIAVTDSAAGLFRFTKYETSNIVQLALVMTSIGSWRDKHRANVSQII